MKTSWTFRILEHMLIGSKPPRPSAWGSLSWATHSTAEGRNTDEQYRQESILITKGLVEWEGVMDGDLNVGDYVVSPLGHEYLKKRGFKKGET